MFVLNDDNSIHATRGDIVFFSVSAEDDGNPYKFQAGDVVRFKVYGKKDAENVVLQKDFPVLEVTENVEIFLTEEDTKIGEVISKPKDYWYEVELNPGVNPQTIIGYDEDGAKVFKLFPEGDDIHDYIPDPEDFRVMDDKLDMTSTRPVQNQAIAKAYVRLISDFEKNREDIAEQCKSTAKVADGAEKAVAVERARIDNLIAHDNSKLAQQLDYLGFISEETRAKIGGRIDSDGVHATITIELREANLVYGGTTMDVFDIPNEGRPIDTGVIHTEDGLEYIISFDNANNHYYLSLRAQDSVTVAPSSAGNVAFTYALGDYELKDVRVGANGETYGSAGSAVRSQFSQLTEKTDAIRWEQGAWDANGPMGSVSFCMRTETALPAYILSAQCPEDMEMHLCAYNEDGKACFLGVDGSYGNDPYSGNLGRFQIVNIAREREKHPNWRFYIVLRYIEGVDISQDDVSKCLFGAVAGHPYVYDRLENITENMRKQLVVNDIADKGVVESGYYNDQNILTAHATALSVTFMEELRQYDFVKVAFGGSAYTDIRIFDTAGKLRVYRRLVNGDAYSFDPTDVGKLTCAYLPDGGMPAVMVYGYEEPVEEKPPFAERPADGLDNFSVEVNYHETTEGKLMFTDYGVLALPTNYTPDGEATRMIVFCQGTGERTDATTNPLNNHGWAYFLSKGYAVMDMNGMATGWGNHMDFPVKNQHYCNKYLLQSYKKGYEYVTKKYNLKKDVFIAGISMGGGASALIVQSHLLPVIAHVAFCPALSVYKQDYMKPWGGVNQQKTIAGQWGFDDWQTATPSQAYFMQNLEKIKGYDNLMINTIGSSKDAANKNYNNMGEEAAYSALSKIYPVPLKIWHCEDDSTVLIRYSKFMVNMIRNADGQAWLRTMPSGGHVGGWNSGKVSDKDINGQDLTTSVPFYEAVLFMQQYE